MTGWPALRCSVPGGHLGSAERTGQGGEQHLGMVEAGEVRVEWCLSRVVVQVVRGWSSANVS